MVVLIRKAYHKTEKGGRENKMKEVRKIKGKENKPYMITAIAILYVWQILNFWSYQDLTNHYLECRQENVELRESSVELRQEILNLHRKTLEALEDQNLVFESLEDTLENLHSQSAH